MRRQINKILCFLLILCFVTPYDPLLYHFENKIFEKVLEQEFLNRSSAAFSALDTGPEVQRMTGSMQMGNGDKVIFNTASYNVGRRLSFEDPKPGSRIIIFKVNPLLKDDPRDTAFIHVKRRDNVLVFLLFRMDIDKYYQDISYAHKRQIGKTFSVVCNLLAGTFRLLQSVSPSWLALGAMLFLAWKMLSKNFSHVLIILKLFSELNQAHLLQRLSDFGGGSLGAMGNEMAALAVMSAHRAIARETAVNRPYPLLAA